MKINRNHLTGLAVLAAFPTAVFASFYYHGRNHTELQNIPPQLIGIWDDWFPLYKRVQISIQLS